MLIRIRTGFLVFANNCQESRERQLLWLDWDFVVQDTDFHGIRLPTANFFVP